MTKPLKHSLLIILLAGYTAFAAGPFVWVAIMSLRTTSEIMADHFALPTILHWEKFPIAWFNSNYNVYFKNSAMIVLSAVVIQTRSKIFILPMNDRTMRLSTVGQISGKMT